MLDNAHQYANVTILQKSNVIVLQIDKEKKHNAPYDMNIYDIEQNSHYFYISQCYTINKNEKKFAETYS